MTTKFGTGIVFRKAEVCVKFACLSSAVTSFSEERVRVEVESILSWS